MRIFKMSLSIIIFVLISFLTISCTDNNPEEQNIKTYALEMNVDSEVTLDSDFINFNENITDKRLQVYFRELRVVHLNLQNVRRNLKNTHNDFIQVRNQFEISEQSLSDKDHEKIVKAIHSLGFNQFMLKQTIGEGYQQLSQVINNHSEYDNDRIKTMLVEVYNIFQARIQIYEDMNETFLSVIVILDKYLET
ncbi:MAG: hypothetical protein K9L64_03235 [Candidatus Izimaplasma sp.]|nr:hypothetical protein [Candidatus Izimaplasma bacterium]